MPLQRDSTSTSDAQEFNYTSGNVPPEILNMIITGDKLYVDVINAGPMMFTNLDQQQAENLGRVKNHWRWRVTVLSPECMGQIMFGFEVAADDSIGSNEARYAASSRVGANSDNSGSKTGSDDFDSESARFSSVESFTKPPAVDTSNIDAGKSEVSQVSDASISRGPYMPIEGAPVPSKLEIKFRPRTSPSWKTYFTRSFKLKPQTTFGELLDVMVRRNMVGFMFRKLNMAYLGCRDGISQAAAWWKEEGLLEDYECVEEPRTHIFKLLGYRYWQSTIPNTLPDPGKLDRSSPNSIDRAVWPSKYVHAEHHELKYNQNPGDLIITAAPV